jgi:hypothetical protein
VIIGKLKRSYGRWRFTFKGKKKVRALPKDLPDFVEADITPLI